LIACIDELGQMYYKKKSKEVQLRPLISSVIFLFVLIVFTFTIVTNSSLIYGQTNQTISDNADLLNIQDIPAKKVRVGDIDIAYKIFGRGNPIY
jgi:p-aminobenzoyl-glutamate transporter AbgT